MTIKIELFKKLFPSFTDHYRQILSNYFTYATYKDWDVLSAIGNVDEIKQELHDYAPFFQEILGIDITADEPQEGITELADWINEQENAPTNNTTAPKGVSSCTKNS